MPARQAAARPSYSDELFDLLERLIVDEPRVVLDIGCGTGAIARPLAARVDWVDAIDGSARMIETARGLASGVSNVRWICDAPEQARIDPPYALATAGIGVRALNWQVVLPRVRDALTPHGQLALIEDCFSPTPWQAELNRWLSRYSGTERCRTCTIADELAQAGLFMPLGEMETAEVACGEPVDAYVQSLHSRETFSTLADGETFDATVRAIVMPFSAAGMLSLAVRAKVIWGRLC